MFLGEGVRHMKKILDLLNPAGQFKKSFRVVHANTPELKKAGFAIRHKVYCEELGFEPVRTSGLETDIHDDSAIHVLMKSALTDEFVGCVRIVRPDDVRPIPMLLLHDLKLDEDMHPEKVGMSRLGEVSRLAVMSKYRNRKGEHETSAGVSDSSYDRREENLEVDRERRMREAALRFPYIPIGLYLGLIELAIRNDIEHLYMLTETRLAGHFGKLGVKVNSIGSPVQHRGERVPSMIHAPSVLMGMRSLFKPLYYEVVRQLDEQEDNEV